MNTFWDRVLLVSGGHPSTWAGRIGIEKSTVSAWRRGTRGPQAATLTTLVERTGIPVEWWLHGTGEIPIEAARRFGLHPAAAPAASQPAEPVAPRPPAQEPPAPKGERKHYENGRMAAAMEITMGLLIEKNLTALVGPGKFTKIAILVYEMLELDESEERVKALADRALVNLLKAA